MARTLRVYFLEWKSSTYIGNEATNVGPEHVHENLVQPMPSTTFNA
jgi:hypothetical protein